MAQACPLSSALGTSALADDSLQHQGELSANLLLVCRKHVDHATDCVHGRVRMMSRSSPMSTTSGSSRNAARSAGANPAVLLQTSR